MARTSWSFAKRQVGLVRREFGLSERAEQHRKWRRAASRAVHRLTRDHEADDYVRPFKLDSWQLW